jgi:hypothetical protein
MSPSDERAGGRAAEAPADRPARAAPAVHLEDAEPSGLAQLVAGLVEAAVAADPRRARLLETTRGAAQLDVPDAGVTVGLKFVPGTLTVTSAAVPGADVRLVTDAATLLELSTVPLRLGLPDPLTAPGRAIVRQLVSGGIRVRGLPFGLPMLRTVTRLLSVS